MGVVCPKHILLLFGVVVACAAGDGQGHTVDCSQIDDDWSLEENLSFLW